MDQTLHRTSKKKRIGDKIGARAASVGGAEGSRLELRKPDSNYKNDGMTLASKDGSFDTRKGSVPGLAIQQESSTFIKRGLLTEIIGEIDTIMNKPMAGESDLRA